MLDKNDLQMLFVLCERVQVSGQEVEDVYKLKMKIISILKMIGQKEDEANRAKAEQNKSNVDGGATLMPSIGASAPVSSPINVLSNITSSPVPASTASQGAGMVNASPSPDGTTPNISATTDEGAEQSASTGQLGATN